MKKNLSLKSLKEKDITPYLVFIIPLTFLCVFLFWPLVTTLLRAFMKPGNSFSLGDLSTKGFSKFVTSKMYQRSLRNSFIVGLSVTFFTLLLGVPMGYFVARVNMPGKKLMLSLGILPIMMPSFVGAFSWVILLGNQGILRHFFNFILSPFGIQAPSIYGLPGMIFCMTMTYYPFVFMLSHGAFSSANALLEDSAMLMGASKWHILKTITFPLIIPSLGAAALLVFIRSVDNFGIPAIIGGEQYVLPTLIYFRVNGFWDLNGAASIAVVNVIITGFVLWFQKYIVNKRQYETISESHVKIKMNNNKVLRVIALIYCLTILIISLAPQVCIIIMSFFEKWTGLFPQGFTLENYINIPSKSSSELLNTFYLAILATIFCAILGSLVAYITERAKPKGAGILDMAIMAPFILPGTVVAVALISAFSGDHFISIGGTFTILIISYMIRRTPYVYRSVAASLTQLNPSLEEASSIMGASWFRTFRKVSVPLIMPGIISGSILTFSTLLQELSTTILLYGSKTRTVPIQIYGAVADGDFGQASALSVLLLVAVFIIVYATNKSKNDLSSGFKMG